jgi:serine O-acetyltransferase
MAIMGDLYKAEPQLIEACLADLQAVLDRDPACDKYTQCLLYFKGFQAVQCHRVGHALWGRGRKVRVGTSL